MTTLWNQLTRNAYLFFAFVLALAVVLMVLIGGDWGEQGLAAVLLGLRWVAGFAAFMLGVRLVNRFRLNFDEAKDGTTLKLVRSNPLAVAILAGSAYIACGLVAAGIFG